MTTECKSKLLCICKLRDIALFGSIQTQNMTISDIGIRSVSIFIKLYVFTVSSIEIAAVRGPLLLKLMCNCFYTVVKHRPTLSW